MKFRRATKWTLIIIGGLLAVTLLFVAFVLFTQAGGNVAVSFVNRSQDQFHVGSFRGRLIHHFELNDIRVTTEAVTADVDTVEVVWQAAPLFGRRVHVRRLRLNGARVVIDVADADSTSASPQPADSTARVFTLPVDITADDIELRGISVDAPDSVRARGVMVRATVADERYDISVGASMYAPVVDSARVDLRASGGLSEVDIDSLRVAAWDGVVTVRGRATWQPGITVAGSVDIDSLRIPVFKQAVNAHLSMSADADARTLRVDTLHAAVGSMTFQGTANADSTVALAFDVNAPDLDALAPSDMGLAGGAQMSVTASGTPREFRVQVSLEGDDIVGAGTRFGDGRTVFDATISASNAGIPARAQIHALNLRTRGIAVEGSGDVRWLPDVAWDVALKADSLRFTRMLADSSAWEGTLAFEATSDGWFGEDGPQANVDIPSLSGVVNGQPLNGRVNGSVDGRRIDARVLELTWGPVHIAGKGTVDEAIDVTFEIDAPDLAAVVPNAAGALQLKVTASGRIDSPAINGEATASGLAYHDVAVQSLTARVDANMSQETGTVRADINASGIDAGGQVVDTLVVSADGNRAAHEVVVSASAQKLALALSLNGGVVDDAWVGRIDDFRVAVTDVGEWNADGPAEVSVGRKHAELDTLCMSSVDSRVCVTGTWSSGDSVRAGIILERFDLAGLAPFLPDSVGIDGTVNGFVVAALRDSAVAADANLAIDGGRVRYKMDGKTQTAEFTGALSALCDATGLTASLDLDVVGSGGKATMNGSLAMSGYQPMSPARPSQPIEASLDIEIPDLAFVEAFARKLEDVSGRLSAHMKAGGTVKSVALTSQIDLTEGHVRIPASGLAIHDIELHAEGDENGRATISGGARSGGGDLKIDGSFSSSRGRWMSADVNVSGDRFTVLNTPEMRVLVSPSIEARVDSSTAVVSGELVVPVARIRLAEVPATAVAPSKDVVYVGVESDGRGPLAVNADVRIVLGDSVSFRGFGFRGDLEGNVLAAVRPARPTTGSGQLKIRNGTYRVYNTQLTIDPGRVIFGGGPIDNPALDVRAYRETNNNVIAGVIVRGTVNKPTIEVYSEPVMAESEALSYLILGRGLRDDSGDGSVLGSAALSMGLAQGSSVTQDLGGQLGLDEAGVESQGPLDEASFVAGKYLSPELYLSYGVGLFDKQTTVRIRYMLTSRWTLQAESGRETSTDLLFRIERGE